MASAPLVAAAVLGQALLWGALYSERGPLVGPLISWLRKRPGTLRTVRANASHQFGAYGFATDSPELVAMWAAQNVAVPLHHTLGGLLAIWSYAQGSASLLVLALSFEIGEDVLHYAQMAYTAAVPAERGVMPWAQAPTSMWLLVGTHHLLGLVAGTGACLCAAASEAAR